jgi:hypothetical protein
MPSLEGSVDMNPQALSAPSTDMSTPATGGMPDYNAQADMAGGMSPDFGSSGSYDPAVAGTTMPSSMEPSLWDQAQGLYKQYGKYAAGGLKMLGGLNDLYQNKQAATMYQGNLNTINNMYMPGTPEYEYMKQQMERQDAAKGRRSQYGVRMTDLAAKTAQMRMNALTSGGYQQSMMGANKSNSGAYAGIAAGLGSLFG